MTPGTIFDFPIPEGTHIPSLHALSESFHKGKCPATKYVYLAGTMAHDWRSPVKRAIEESGSVAWLPQDNPQQSAALYVPGDLKMATECDALLAVIDNTHSAWGTHAEMGVAFSNNKPIWLVWDRGPSIYSFSAVMAYKIFTELQPAVDDLLKFLKGGVL